MPSDTGRPVPYLDEVALTFPELTIVGGHIGHPWTVEMIGLTWKHDNVDIDTSAYLPEYYPPELVDFVMTTAMKVLFSTRSRRKIPAHQRRTRVQAELMHSDIPRKN
jgi:hypothetical protein